MISAWLYVLAAVSAVAVYYLIRFNIALANQKKAEAEQARQRAEAAQLALEQKRLETIALKTAELNAQATRKQEQKEVDAGNRGHFGTGEW